MVKGRRGRWASVPFSAGFIGLVLYRVQRAGHLRFGPRWRLIHTALSPLWMLARPLSGPMELSYRADIGPGMRVLHPSLGVVVSANCVIGKGLILTGGNCIGSRQGGDVAIVIEDHVTLGANAVVLGPVIVGHHSMIGAGAVVVDNVAPATTVTGVPARPTQVARAH